VVFISGLIIGMDPSEQIAWTTVAIIVTLIVLGIGYMMTQSRAPTGKIALISLFTVILSFTVGIGFVVNTQVNTDDIEMQRAGINAALGQVWPLAILSMGLMGAIIKTYTITTDSRFYFFAAFFVLFFCTLMMELVYINKMDEISDLASTIDASKTGTFLTVITFLTAGYAVWAIIF
jgi:hypothetical protein